MTSYHGRRGEKISRGDGRDGNYKRKKLNFKKINSKRQAMYCSRLDSSEKVLTSAGIEPESPRLLVCSAKEISDKRSVSGILNYSYYIQP